MTYEAVPSLSPQQRPTREPSRLSFEKSVPDSSRPRRFGRDTTARTDAAESVAEEAVNEQAPVIMSRAERRRAGLHSGAVPVGEVVIDLAMAAEAASGGAASVEVFDAEPATIVMSLDDVQAAMAAEAASAPAAPTPGSRRAKRAAQQQPGDDTADEPVAPEVLVQVAGPEDAASGPVVIAAVEPDTAATEEVRDEQAPAASADSEPSRPAEPAAETDADGTHAEQTADEFEAAARRLGFTGETPIVRTPEPAETSAEAVHLVAVRRRGRRVIKRVAAAGSSLIVMSLAGVLAVGLTASPAAIAASSPDAAAAAGATVLPGDVQFSDEEIQAFVAPSDADPIELGRDEKYGTVTVAEIASESGIQNFSSDFTNDPNAAIQWPFDVGVPMSYGYGMRSGRLHEGIDFTPGSGAPIQAIADGVVRIATESGGAYGVTVMIDHVIDGELISSRYAHMQYGSLQVVEGQHVKVGDMIGRVGETGRAYGAHLHFELHDSSGNSFDPWPWMVAHAGGASE